MASRSRTAEVVAAELEGRPVELTDDTATWLTLTMPPAVTEREAIAGVAAATAALSREICALCGGQGDPGPAHRQLAEHALQGLPNGRPAGSAWTPAGPGAASSRSKSAMSSTKSRSSAERPRHSRISIQPAARLHRLPDSLRGGR